MPPSLNTRGKMVKILATYVLELTGKKLTKEIINSNKEARKRKMKETATKNEMEDTRGEINK